MPEAMAPEQLAPDAALMGLSAVALLLGGSWFDRQRYLSVTPVVVDEAPRNPGIGPTLVLNR